MWEWYVRWGLITTIPTQKYLTFNARTPVFHSDVLHTALQQGFFRRLRASMIFSSRAAKALRTYDASRIDALYERELACNYAKMGDAALVKKYALLWDLLMENIKYALLAGLVEQYKLHVDIARAYCTDIQAEKMRALSLLGKAQMTKKEFNAQFGFLSHADYDFSAPRYAEQKHLQVLANAALPSSDGPHNVRMHIRFRSAKLIALMRKILLQTHGKNFYYYFKEEILTRTNVHMQHRMKEFSMQTPAFAMRDDGAVLSGVCLSGEGIITGTVRIVDSAKDYAAIKKGEIAITKNLSPELVGVFPVVVGIVSEKGTALSHTAIVAREQRLAIVGQVRDITRILHTGERIEVRVKEGTIRLLSE